MSVDFRERKVARKRVFLSFIVGDRKQVDGLRLLGANPNYDLEFYDESVRVPFESLNAGYIKQKIREKIGRTTVTVCLISEGTHESTWVDWELEGSAEKDNTIIAMALKGVERAILPRLIRDKQLPFHAWDPQHLARLITES
ncbi:MAG: TIR domain-containing protein [Candidatus Rokuibacteriota bacterium]